MDSDHTTVAGTRVNATATQQRNHSFRACESPKLLTTSRARFCVVCSQPSAVRLPATTGVWNEVKFPYGVKSAINGGIALP